MQNMDVSKTGDHIQMRIKMLNPCQYPPASSKSSNQDLKDMDFLGTFKIKMDSLNSGQAPHGANPRNHDPRNNGAKKINVVLTKLICTIRTSNLAKPQNPKPQFGERIKYLWL